MGRLRSYRFELCWLIVVMLFYALAPERTTAQTFSHEEAADDCPPVSGWCPGIRIFMAR